MCGPCVPRAVGARGRPPRGPNGRKTSFCNWDHAFATLPCAITLSKKCFLGDQTLLSGRSSPARRSWATGGCAVGALASCCRRRRPEPPVPRRLSRSVSTAVGRFFDRRLRPACYPPPHLISANFVRNPSVLRHCAVHSNRGKRVTRCQSCRSYNYRAKRSVAGY